MHHKLHHSSELVNECLCHSKHTMAPMRLYTKFPLVANHNYNRSLLKVAAAQENLLLPRLHRQTQSKASSHYLFDFKPANQPIIKQETLPSTNLLI